MPLSTARQLHVMIGLLVEDTIFENTLLPPDGALSKEKKLWVVSGKSFSTPHYHPASIPKIYLHPGERVVMRWVYHWASLDKPPDIFAAWIFTGSPMGCIAEKLSYVKG